ncbi:hypothetical protein RND81_12G063100 [Saponaria officinalis]
MADNEQMKQLQEQLDALTAFPAQATANHQVQMVQINRRLKANPLSNHTIFVGSIPIIDLAPFINPPEPEINGIWFSDEDDEWPPKLEVNKINYTAVPRKYGKKKNKRSKGKSNAPNEISYLTRSRKAQENPWVSDKDAEVIPNKDKGKSVVEEATPTASAPTVDIPTASTADAIPPPKVIEDVLHKQFLKIKADITIWQLLRDSEEHKNAFFEALKKVKTNSEASPAQVVSHISTDLLPGAITFSDADLPPFDSEHNLALYIDVECLRKSLPVTLIDNGSAVNVLPLNTAYLLGLKDQDFIPCNEGVRAFDGTHRNIKGTVTLRIKTGPVERKTDFQVIDVAPSYNMLLGRPWMHSVQAITSTLHQKVKLPLNGEIITIEATNLRAVLDKQQGPEKNTAEITAEPMEDLVGFDFEIAAISPDDKPLWERVALFNAKRKWPTQGLGYEPSIRDIVEKTREKWLRKRTRDIVMRLYTFDLSKYFIKQDKFNLLDLFHEQVELDIFYDCFANDTNEASPKKKLPSNNAELLAMVIRDPSFNPNLLVTDLSERTTQGWRKTLKWTDSRGRTFKLTTGEGPIFEDSDSDTDSEEENEEEIILGSNVLRNESGNGSIVDPKSFVSPSVVADLKAGLESLVISSNLNSEQFALLSSTFENNNDKNSSAYFLSHFLSSISSHNTCDNNKNKTLFKYIANTVYKNEPDPIIKDLSA